MIKYRIKYVRFANIVKFLTDNVFWSIVSMILHALL